MLIGLFDLELAKGKRESTVYYERELSHRNLN